jgi:hypothetical protein
MLRVTEVNGAESARTLKLEGKLLEPWVGELLRACAPAGRLSLDLSAVTFVDGAGVELLQTLLRRGVRVIACSGFVAELLHVEQ